ncbi:DUF2278 family protein [Massilia endophytica]|uniref:DUF2278 family protein n=1 Tax=Massilia endophytica TaxID=2899220 RepID=UPI001E3EA073|nr:DUF2278 family protein [Massilia endophytica]UGQ47831.1 YukJ family protein [Massilia endophytica]
MSTRKLLHTLLFGTAALSAAAQAALPTYGYVTGNFVAGSNYLEPLDVQGKFLHYHFKIETAPGILYEAVIDVKNGHLYPFPQRVVDIKTPELYTPVLGSTNGYHAISMTSAGGNPAQGAMDYIRHPGLLQDMRSAWQYIKATPTADPNVYTMPQWDQLFNGVVKIYAFGQPYSSGYGVHVVHQNQADKKSQFYGSNGLYQDGAVIFEYANGDRKILLTRFADQPGDLGQGDFSYESDPDGSGPLRIGVNRNPTVVSTYCDQTMGGGESVLPGFESCTFGPFAASQIEVETTRPGAYASEIYFGTQDGPPTSLTGEQPQAASMQSARLGAQTSAYVAEAKNYRRSYTKAANGVSTNYYVYIPMNSDGSATNVTIRYVP